MFFIDLDSRQGLLAKADGWQFHPSPNCPREISRETRSETLGPAHHPFCSKPMNPAPAAHLPVAPSMGK
jgi:hypothetical protein